MRKLKSKFFDSDSATHEFFIRLLNSSDSNWKTAETDRTWCSSDFAHLKQNVWESYRMQFRLCSLEAERLRELQDAVQTLLIWSRTSERPTGCSSDFAHLKQNVWETYRMQFRLCSLEAERLRDLALLVTPTALTLITMQVGLHRDQMHSWMFQMYS